MSSLTVRTLAVGPLQANCTIVGHLPSKQYLVTDCGGDAKLVLREAQKLGLTACTANFYTHGHLDHVMGASELKEATGAPVLLHKNDDDLLWKGLEKQCRNFGLKYRPVPPVDQHVKEGDVVAVGEVTGKVLETPGHSPGGICLYFEEENLLIAGDTLFRGSFGRTDLWGGSESTLFRSLKRLFQLPDNVRVITGHGEETTIGYEKKNNMCRYMMGTI